MLRREGKVIVISSVSGGGKTTVIGELVRRHRELAVAITATSRPPRDGERDGEHYHFLSREEFEPKIEEGGFLEHATVHGNHYGVPMDQVEKRLQQGESIILNIDVQGMKTIRDRMKERALTIFLLPPDEKTWEERLRGRGTDSDEVILQRLDEGNGNWHAPANTGIVSLTLIWKAPFWKWKGFSGMKDS